VLELDPGSGSLTPVQVMPADGPTVIAVSPDHGKLYAACTGWRNEHDEFSEFRSFAIDPATGSLTAIDGTQIPAGPTYVSLDHTGRFALLSFGTAGSVGVVPLGPSGQLAEPSCVVPHDAGPSILSQGITSSTMGKHAWSSDSVLPHSIVPDPSNRFVLACDVGWNRIAVYRFDAASGSLTPNSPSGADGAPIDQDLPTRNRVVWETPRGAGPRFPCFGHGGDRLYVTNEAGSSVSVFSYDASSGGLARMQDISALPDGWTKVSSAADIKLHPNGRFLYVTNRGHDSIATFEIEPKSGQLKIIGHVSTGGNRPRSIALTPDGRLILVANVRSHAVRALEIDPDSGLPRLLDGELGIPSPTCVQVLPL
jgi:6-phosphogluconolactonase